MAELKQGRWVKVHEPGQGNYVENENVMDIVIGVGRCQAEATYTVRSYKKAAYWLNEYLKAAEALPTIAEDMVEKVTAAADMASKEDDEVTAEGAGWNCGIEKMGDGSFRVHLAWLVDEPVTKKAKAQKKAAKKRGGRRKKEADAE